MNRQRLADYQSLALSLLFHGLLLCLLAWMTLPTQEVEQLLMTTIGIGVPQESAQLEKIKRPHRPTDVHTEEISLLSPTVAKQADLTDMEINVDDNRLALPKRDTDFRAPNIARRLAGHLAGRSQQARAALLEKYGGSAASEAAVALGLQWLAAHQDSDGSWSFDHTRAECGDSCTQPGTLERCRNAATGLALLTFLGGGQTHFEGNHQTAVERGLTYLIDQMEVTSEGGNLQGVVIQGPEAMYAHGIATIALCEAYGMMKQHVRANQTRWDRPTLRSQVQASKRLEQAAQLAVNFLVNAQDPKEGGWRYRPRQSGDTSVSGWQIMALQSARNAGLKVPRRTWNGAMAFLDSVQADGGAAYGYRSPDRNRPTLTAVGLLCRMYLGWNRRKPALQVGVESLSRHGPDKNNIYYNYYATQVLHHWGGQAWKEWNDVLRDHLIETQIKTGHAAGSWNVADPHGSSGGRLYMTCLAVMTLEVYYRYLPLYHNLPVSDEP